MRTDHSWHVRRTLVRTSPGPDRGPQKGRPGRRRGRWEAPVGPLRGRRAHSPIVKDIPVAGRQPRPPGHFFPFPALRERRALPPLPLHCAPALRPTSGPPSPMPPPLLPSRDPRARHRLGSRRHRRHSPRLFRPAGLRPPPPAGRAPALPPARPPPRASQPPLGGPLRPPARAGACLRRRGASPAPSRPRDLSDCGAESLRSRSLVPAFCKTLPTAVRPTRSLRLHYSKSAVGYAPPRGVLLRIISRIRPQASRPIRALTDLCLWLSSPIIRPETGTANSVAGVGRSGGCACALESGSNAPG